MTASPIRIERVAEGLAAEPGKGGVYRFQRRAGLPAHRAAKFERTAIVGRQYERGIEAYRLLQKLEPLSPHGYEYALAIAQGLSTMQDWDKLDKQYRSIIADYTVPPVVKGKQPEPPPGDGH